MLGHSTYQLVVTIHNSHGCCRSPGNSLSEVQILGVTVA